MSARRGSDMWAEVVPFVDLSERALAYHMRISDCTRAHSHEELAPILSCFT